MKEGNQNTRTSRRRPPGSEARSRDVARLVAAVLVPLLRDEWLREDEPEAREGTATRFLEGLERATASLVGLVRLHDGLPAGAGPGVA